MFITHIYMEEIRGNRLCVYYCRTYYKAVCGVCLQEQIKDIIIIGEGDSEGHVL